MGVCGAARNLEMNFCQVVHRLSKSTSRQDHHPSAYLVYTWFSLELQIQVQIPTTVLLCGMYLWAHGRSRFTPVVTQCALSLSRGPYWRLPREERHIELALSSYGTRQLGHL